ncbi:MAG: hypothetical protein ACREXX_07505 [Gammaproteobacteria bacterium]
MDEIQKIRAILDKRLPEIIEVIVAAAKSGDIAAAKLILDRTVPVFRHTRRSAKTPRRDPEQDPARQVEVENCPAR